MATGEYTLLDAYGDGSALGNNAYEIQMSGDGQHVMFEVQYASLLPEDTNGRSDVYVWSWATDEFVLASETPTSAVVTDRGARSAGMSADGRYIGIFTGRDMVPADTNGSQDLRKNSLEQGTLFRWLKQSLRVNQGRRLSSVEIHRYSRQRR